MKIARSFTIPNNFVTETFAVLARKGAGKTYTASVMAEELLAARQQIVVIDPLDAWWGLRSSADGRASGFPVTVFGGQHGDLPLDENMARAIADLVAETPDLSCILSLRHLRKNRQRRFIMEFLEQLYHRKGEAKLQTPVHLFIDEADMTAPQRVEKGMERLLGAAEDIVRRGRQAGIGITMISQRPQAVNKQVLSMIEVLIVGQITGPHDKKAIKAWIEDNASIEKQAAFIASLAKLRVGEFWLWSPSRLRVLKKIKVRKRVTFDSSATPKLGAKRRAPKKLARIELKQIQKRLGAVVEQATKDDPKVLRRRIAELERAARKGAAREPRPQHAGLEKRVKADAEKRLKAEIERHKRNVSRRLLSMRPSLEALSGRLQKFAAEVDGHLAAIQEAKSPTMTDVRALPLPQAERPGDRAAHRDAPRSSEPALAPRSANGLSRCERAILTVLAQRDRACTKKLTALQSGYSVKSGGFANALSTLRTAGHIERNGTGGDLRITPEGLDALGDYDPLPTGEDLIAYWKGKLRARALRVVFTVLADAHPQELTKEAVAEAAQYSATSGGFANALSSLRTLELIEGRGLLHLSEELFA